MTLKLALVPEPTGYSLQDGDDVIRQSLSGGMGRYRADILHSTKTVSCQWSVDPGGYNYLRSFYNHHTRQAAKFRVDLIIDLSELTEHVAMFMPGGLKLTGTQGLMYTVSCQLEVVPIDNSALDTAIVELVTTELNYLQLSVLLLRLAVFANGDLGALSV